MLAKGPHGEFFWYSETSKTFDCNTGSSLRIWNTGFEVDIEYNRVKKNNSPQNVFPIKFLSSLKLQYFRSKNESYKFNDFIFAVITFV